MKTTTGDLFKPTPAVDAICIPTNGMTKKRPRGPYAVMGAGVAKIARDRWPGIDIRLGRHLTTCGNFASVLTLENELPFDLIAFPTKHHWKDKSDLELIKRSAHDTVAMTDAKLWNTVWLPAVGAGLGGLSWKEQVEPLLSSILDDRFTVVFRK